MFAAARRLQADNVTVNCTATANCCSGTAESGAGGSGEAGNSGDTSSGASSADYGSASGSEVTDTNDTSTQTTAAPSGLLSVLPSVEWFFNGNLITSYNSTSSAQTITNLIKYGFDTDPFSATYGHLTLVNIMLSDTGVYRCIASNVDGSQSSSLRLQVQGMFIQTSNYTFSRNSLCIEYAYSNYSYVRMEMLGLDV